MFMRTMGGSVAVAGLAALLNNRLDHGAALDDALALVYAALIPVAVVGGGLALALEDRPLRH
jgi:hypothetical protein